jgi:16S rRNA (guanine527-N7)-methyltransferase
VTPQQVCEDALNVSVSRETFERLSMLVDLVIEENQTQNLISASSVDAIWTRHIADSLQLLRYVDPGSWLDLGTGAGFPGLVVAAVIPDRIMLCEERRIRAGFLERASAHLQLTNVTVRCARVEHLETVRVQTISARAFAPLDKLLRLAHRFSTEKTRWVLPKGRNAAAELESVRGTWHGDFRLEPSVTDPDSHIIVATGIRPKAKR